MKLDMSFFGGIQLNYDSTDPNAKIDNPDLAFLGDVFKMASQVTYTVVLDGRNKVKAIEGTEKLLEKVDKLDEKARGLIRSQFESDKLKAQFEQDHGNLPDVLARPGDSWERTENLEGAAGQKLSFRKKYEYTGTEKKGDRTFDKIKVKATEVKLTQDADDAAPFKITKSDLKVNSSEGTILFDREAGCVVESQGKTQIKGSLTITAQGQELAGELELNLDIDMRLQPGAK